MRSFNFLEAHRIESQTFKRLSAEIENILKPVQGDKLLIGLSGGPDSTALLHCFLHYSKHCSLKLGVAHVDHRWRKESAAEAAHLKHEIENLNLPFHLKVLDPNHLEGNLEQCCRNERLRFFSEICKSEGYRAVILAHHRDDLVETVLKRILEGASLHGLNAIEVETYFKNLCVLRPWLNIPKEDILHYIIEHQLSYFDDPTNIDSRFLRGRMREQLFPLVEKSFGKSIKKSLFRLSRESSELNDYLEQRLSSTDFGALIGPFGECVDFTSAEHPYEIRWLLRTWLKEKGLDVSHAIFEEVLELVMDGKSDRRVLFKGAELQIDRKKVFLISDELPAESSSVKLEPGVYQWGEWEVTVSDKPFGDLKQGWKAVWKGQIMTTIPKGDYYLGSFRNVLNQEEIKKIQKKWTNAKVPSFLRDIPPVIASNGFLFKEFLMQARNKAEEGHYYIVLKFNRKTPLP